MGIWCCLCPSSRSTYSILWTRSFDEFTSSPPSVQVRRTFRVPASLSLWDLHRLALAPGFGWLCGQSFAFVEPCGCRKQLTASSSTKMSGKEDASSSSDRASDGPSSSTSRPLPAAIQVHGRRYQLGSAQQVESADDGAVGLEAFHRPPLVECEQPFNLPELNRSVCPDLRAVRARVDHVWAVSGFLERIMYEGLYGLDFFRAESVSLAAAFFRPVVSSTSCPEGTTTPPRDLEERKRQAYQSHYAKMKEEGKARHMPPPVKNSKDLLWVPQLQEGWLHVARVVGVLPCRSPQAVGNLRVRSTIECVGGNMCCPPQVSTSVVASVDVRRDFPPRVANPAAVPPPGRCESVSSRDLVRAQHRVPFPFNIEMGGQLVMPMYRNTRYGGSHLLATCVVLRIRQSQARSLVSQVLRFCQSCSKSVYCGGRAECARCFLRPTDGRCAYGRGSEASVLQGRSYSEGSSYARGV